MPSTSEIALETTLNDLANARLRDRAPGLVPYMLGFQLLDHNEDGTRAVGIFGFEIDDAIYYVPAMFANGEIKGVDSIYSVDSDLFMPLSEDWTNTLIRRKSQKLGDTDHKSMQAVGVRQPNYRRLTMLPPSNANSGGIKMASAREYANTVSLVEGAEWLGAKGWVKAAMDRSPKFASAVRKFYDELDFIEIPKAKTAADKRPVTIVTGFTSEGVERLTDEQRKNVIRGGIAVLDDRPETEKSMVWKTETSLQLSNPGVNGLYDILLANGEVVPAYCGRLAHQDKDSSSRNLVVITDDKAGMVSYSAANVVRQYAKPQLAEFINKRGKKPTDLSADDLVIFVGLEGQVSLPFKIKSIISGSDELTVYTGECQPQMDERWEVVPSPAKVANHLEWEPGLAPQAFRRDTVISSSETRLQGYPVERVNQVVVRKGNATGITYSSNKLVVSEDGVRAIVLASGREYGVPTSKLLQEADLGNFQTTQAVLTKVAQDVSVWASLDGQINIRDKSTPKGFTKVAALEHLMVNLGMGEKDASEIVKTAGMKPKHYWVKQASELLAFPELNDQSEGGYMGQFTTEQRPFETRQTVSSPDNSRYYDYISPFAGGVPEQDNTLDVVADAAELGNKDVFDAAALASLIKAARPTEMVERFLPTMVSGMDRMGRLLFLILWHYDEFKDRFGDELPEIMDNLRSTFEHLGELVIKLKERSLSGDPAFFGSLDAAE